MSVALTCQQCGFENSIQSLALVCEKCSQSLAQSGMTLTLHGNSASMNADTIMPKGQNDATLIADQNNSNQDPAQLDQDSMAHFKITDILGKGGMGTVYKAQDLALERFVAIKMFRVNNTSSANQQTILAEAKTISKVNHPNIVTIYDIARGEDNNFIVMEWVDGRPLNYQIPSDGLPLKKTLQYARQIIAAIACAHQNNIIHRDIKPQNIMVDFNDRIKVLDFGIASLIQGELLQDGQDTNKEQQGLIGTPQYMAPEQISGQAIDARSDLFAFGIVLYEMLCGSKPFLGLNIKQITDAITLGEYKSLASLKPELPQSIIDLVEKLLQVNPELRYQNAKQVDQDLETIWQTISLKKNWWQRQHWLAKTAMIVPLLFVTGWGFKEILFPPTTQELVQRQMLESKKIAIVPFDNISGDPVLQIFSDGVATMLSSDLAEVGYQQGDGTTWVLPASEMRQMKEPTIENIYNKYGVDLILTGSIQHMGSTRSVNLSLVNGADGRQLKSVQLSIDAEQLFEAQTQIRQQVMDLLGWQLPPQLASQFDAQKPAFDGAYKYYLEGQGYLYRFDQAGNTDRAIEAFEKAIEIDPGYGDAYVGLARVQLRNFMDTKENQWLDRVSETIKRLELTEPNHPLHHYLLGETLQKRGLYDEAIEAYKKSIERRPNFVESHIGLSNTLIKINKNESAASILQGLYRMKPNDSSVLSHLGVFYFNQGKYQNAIDFFEILSLQAPDNHWAYINISACHYLKGDIKLAIEAAKKSLSLFQSASTYSNLGTYYFMLRQYSKSVEAYEKMIEINNNDYTYWGNLADAYRFASDRRYIGAFNQAVERAKVALTINAKNSDAIASIAYYLANIGEIDSALNYAEQITDENSGMDNFVVATAYARLNIKAAAIKHLKYAVAKNYSKNEIQDSQLLESLREEPEFLKLFNDT